MLPEQQQRILGYFIEEAKDHLNTIEQGLLNLQATIVNPEMANEVFRAAHSVKGGAAMLGIESMQRTAHRMEDYFKLLKEAPIKVDRSLESMFLRVFDALQELLEQLQGPFGLTEEKEQSIMAGVEPVFQQLQEHLDQLVADADTNEVLEEVAPVAFTSPSPQPVEESALKLVFSSDVSAALREMLARFKQADTDESRLALEACCQMLERFGEQFNLPTWMNLVKHGRWAVCDRNNDYRTLAPVLIKEIKKAQDLVLAGREREILLSQELQTLGAAPEDVVDTPDSLDDLFADDALFTTNESEDTSVTANSDAIDIDDLSALEPNLDIDSVEPSPSPTEDGISIDDLLNNAVSTPSGPEVGAAELTSLADLFETSGDALDSDWQEEEVPITEGTSPSESLDIDISPDFEDLLNDDSSELGTNLNDFESGSELADLFGDTDNTDSLDNLDNSLEDPNQPSDTTNLSPTDTSPAENVGPLDGLFGDMATTDEVASVDDLFGDVDQSLPEPSIQENLDISSNLDELGALTSLETTSNDLTDIDLALDNATVTSETDALLSDSLEVATKATNSGFFSEDTSTPETSDSSDSEQSEFDDFFTVDEAIAEPPQKAVSGSLDDALWTENNRSDSASAPTPLGELSPDIWDSNPEQSLDNAAITDTDIDTSTQNIPDNNNLDGLELDDVWASVEDIDLDAAIAEPTQAGADVASTDSPKAELDDLFNNTGPELTTDDGLFGDTSPELTNDSAQETSTSSSLNEGFDGLFGENLENPDLPGDGTQPELDVFSLDEGLDNPFSDNIASEIAVDNLFNDSPAELASDIAGLDDGLENLELAESATGISDMTDLDVSLSGLNPTNSNLESTDIVSEPPSNDIEFDLLDLEDDGIVTGFVTDDNNLENDVETSLNNDTETDLLTDMATDEVVPAPFTDLNPELNELGLENSLNELEDSTIEVSSTETPAAEAPSAIDDLFETPDTPSSEQALDPAESIPAVDDLFETPADTPSNEQALEPAESSSAVDDLFDTPADTPSSEQALKPAESPSAIDDLFDTPADTPSSEQALEPAESPSAVDDLFDTPDTISSEQALEPLDSLLSSELPEEISQATTLETDDNNEFGDLEALLDTSEESVSPAPSTLSTSPTPPAASTSGDDEFGDLEALLQDADQTLAPTSASSTSYRPTSNRLSSRRIVTDQTMRVSVSHLDNLSNLVGELVVNRNTLEQDQERLRQFLDNLLFQVQQLNDVGQRMRDLYERSLLESSLISSRQSYQTASTSTPAETDLSDHATGESFDALEMDRFTGFHTLSQEMIELIVRVRESASDIAYTVESSDQVTRQFRQVTNQLQEGLNKARMVPFAQTASRLPRAVRDISVKCGKEARLIVEGRDILIDKMILEQLYDPMTHLVNNAITHGVETPDERRLAGKTPEGVITVRAFYQGNQTVISVGDDGAGINPDIVKQKALQKGLISQSDIQTMTVLDVYDLLFHPGFSTRDQADDFAGRGFGMDVVRTSLADIRGNITIDSELGRGTNFTIRLPLTLSISKALSCISNQARIAFPMDGVEDMFDVSRERIQKNDQDEDCILWRDTLLPFQNLSDLLSFNRTLGRGRVYGGNQDENMISIVVLRSANSFIALEVDQVMGEQEIVIKQLEGPVPKPTGIAGATVLGDGRVMPIADVLELIDLALGRVRRDPTTAVWSQLEESAPSQEEPAKVKSEPTVLIVDDSITVRELLSMSFNKVGYRVEQARDGQEAWEKLRSGLPCDLVFCDIEMPRMDGLELLSRLQKDDGLQQIPIAMLTSRGADRHRQMAVDLGASGYFTKPYLEEALLDAANKMLHGERLV
ncbi:hybrid sensor histidine kinase/response regulator [Leptothoe spongobia]|uniref:histidine kinase n=1 Tax=Leptothoe spongobia TAU-MAC 1115 TaxID=1967444 RepID=A0A947DDZ7_9CYAN|nr:response regulator [Leptothoe spongobia]MBT9315226.1 response regulator [Leptothoe spongobia TAU-MAC 1115]